jgi:hypothetical protein
MQIPRIVEQGAFEFTPVEFATAGLHGIFRYRQVPVVGAGSSVRQHQGVVVH